MEPTRSSHSVRRQENAQHRSEISRPLAGEKRANIIAEQGHKYLPGNRNILYRLVFAIIGQQGASIGNKSTILNHDKSLLIATKSPEQSSSAICDHNIKQETLCNSKQPNNTEKYQLCIPKTQKDRNSRTITISHLVTLVIISLQSFQYAPSCLAFSNSEYNLDPGLIGYSYPNEQYQQQQTPVTTKTSWSQPIRSFMRQLNDDPMTFMSTMMGSLSQDQDSTGVPGQQSPTWTSILTNPFGMPQRPNNQNNVDQLLDAHIKKILVPRVSGTQGNIEVREYIVNSMKKNNYHVELDEFTGSTPIGNVKFANIIASSNPRACRQLVLACHYDSKMMEGFLGAVDSAVPCAMLLRISETFNKSFRATSGGGVGDDEDDNSPAKDSLGLKFIFFDGEEAFVQWSSTDSLYGSRHLAAKWSKQQAPADCKLGPNKSELSRIELFVLLDLIGSSDTSFVMYNTRLRHHYESLQKYEKAHLTRAGYGSALVRRESAFKGRIMPFDFVEDDHVPFKQRNVPILLLLAHPFPKVWHTTDDNYDAIDFPKTIRILNVLEEFVSNYSK